MPTLTRRVTMTAVKVLSVSLVSVGLVTGGLLHLRARHALDQALLAAAFAEAHPWQERRYANTNVNSPVQVRPWHEDDPRVSRELRQSAISTELPQWATIDGYRILVLVVEPELDPPPTDEGHRHLTVIAEAPAMTVSRTLVPFASVYLFVSALALGGATIAIRLGMRRALSPLFTASASLQRVKGLGSSARLDPTGAGEVDRVIDAVNDLLDRLERAFATQSAFTAQAAHELRTPLTVMKGELELALRRERSPDAYVSSLRESLHHTNQLCELVESLMALTRVEAGHADTARTREHVSQVLLRAVEREQSQLEQAGCALTLDIGDDPEITGHLGLLTTAVANLLRNAAVHAPGQPVHVHTETAEDVVRVHVDDAGAGIPQADRERVAERFERRGRADGLGLGLPLVKQVLLRHGGDLTLSDSPAGGLRATMTLPRHA